MQRITETSDLLHRLNRHRILDSPRFAIYFALALDLILFAGLLGAELVLHATSPEWAGRAETGIQLAYPMVSGATLWLSAVALVVAMRAQWSNHLRSVRIAIGVSLVFLVGFLVLNGFDWVQVARMEQHAHSLYGGVYFMITGIFHFHVAAAIVMGIARLRQTLRWKRYTRSTVSIEYLLYFIAFLSGIWMAISFVLVP